MALSVGYDMDPEFAKAKFSGGALKEIFAFIQAQIDQPLPADFEQKYRQKTFERFKTDIQPIEGIETVLQQLEVPICVASSGPMNKIVLNLSATGLIDYFKGQLFSAYDIGSWKPDPDLFLHAAKTMGFKPSQCAVIEDSIFGIQAGRAGGFDVFGYCPASKRPLFEAEGAVCFDHMNQLLEHLQ